MKHERITTLGKIPKEGRLERYLREPYQERTREEIFSFWESIFKECLEFVIFKLKPISLPRFRLNFVLDTKNYEEIEKEHEKATIVEEEAKSPSSAFIVHNRFRATIYVNVESLLALPNVESLTLNLIETYLHEILHACGIGDEQTTHDVLMPLLEEFVGTKLPEDRKNLKASDYYKKRSRGKLGAPKTDRRNTDKK